MNLYLRLFVVLISNLLRKKFTHFTNEIVTTFKVFPNDLDLNFHMNNGRFLTIMDLGRLDYLGKTGILKPALKKKWMPILGAANIVYLRPLKCWQKYTLHTKLEYWDNKWFIISQRFEVNGKVYAQAYVRGLLRGKQGNIKPEVIMQAAGYETIPAPSAPSMSVQNWLAAINHYHKK